MTRERRKKLLVKSKVKKLTKPKRQTRQVMKKRVRQTKQVIKRATQKNQKLSLIRILTKSNRTQKTKTVPIQMTPPKTLKMTQTSQRFVYQKKIYTASLIWVYEGW